MTDDIREAFLSHIPEEHIQESGEDDARLPMAVVPDALERLGLDGDDDFVLSILRDVAEPLGSGAGARRRGQSDMGIPYDQWKEVVEVLLAQQQQQDAHARGGRGGRAPSSPEPDVEPEQPSGRRLRLTARAARATSSSWVVGDTEEEEPEDDDDDDDDDDDNEEDEDRYEAQEDDDAPAGSGGGGGVRRRRTRATDYESDQEEESDRSSGSDEEGGFLPVRKPIKRPRTTQRKGSGKLTDAHHERANHVAGLFWDQLDPEPAEASPARDPSTRRFGPQDLVAVAKKMGDTLSLQEAQEMVQQAVRLGNEQAPSKYQASTVSSFELAAVIRKLGMRRS